MACEEERGRCWVSSSEEGWNVCRPSTPPALEVFSTTTLRGGRRVSTPTWAGGALRKVEVKWNVEEELEGMHNHHDDHEDQSASTVTVDRQRGVGTEAGGGNLLVGCGSSTALF